MNQVQHLPLLVSNLKSKTFADRNVPRRTKPSVHGLFDKSASSLHQQRKKKMARDKAKSNHHRVKMKREREPKTESE